MSKKIVKTSIIDPGSPPDVDTDFETTARHEVIKYAIEKYGSDNVASLITPGPFKVKNAWKSMATIHSVPFSEANKISSLLPDGADGTTIKDLIDPASPKYEDGLDLRIATDSDELREILEYADNLSGRMRETGVHPCGIVISSRKLTDSIPVQIRQVDEMPVTQWNYYDCEALGLIKMDFLGLDTVDLIENTVRLIKQTKGIDLDMEEIIEGSLDDKEVFKLFSEARTDSIFQFSGEGVKELLKAVKPTRFEDLAAITALYRPGPMGLDLHNDFAIRKNDPTKRTPVHKDFVGTKLEEILEPTLGALIYQEQVMIISKECAGFSSKEADELRKAIGKKKMDLMRSLEGKFKAGMITNGYTETSVNVLWDGIVAFGSYAFNLSHSVSYALNSYQCAYLKVHYPAEYMASVLKQRIRDDAISSLFAETKKMGIEIQVPSINNSGVEITPDPTGTYISYGLSSIKGVGSDVIEKLIEERNKNGIYKDIKDFIQRNSEIIKKGTLINLAQAGAFDCLNVTRKDIVENADNLLKKLSKAEQLTANNSLFDLIGSSLSDKISIDLPNEEWGFPEKIKKEAEATGLYLTSNPLDNIVDSNGVNISNSQMAFDDPNLQGEIYATFTKIISKKNRQGKTTYIVMADNKVSQRELRLPVQFTERFNLYKALEKTNGDRKKAYEKLNLTTDDQVAKYNNYIPLAPLKPFTTYKLTFKKWNNRISLVDLVEVELSPKGKLLKKLKVTSPNHNDFIRIIEDIQANTFSDSELSDIRIYNYNGDLYRDLSDVYVKGSTFATHQGLLIEIT